MEPPARCLVMGVLNTTPDSFSDGGRFTTTEAAVAHGLSLVADGADLVDVGGESTRPGAERVSLATELERVLPVVEQLTRAGVAVSVDTMRAEVAARAVRAGAVLVNDVSGGLADPDLLPAVADLRVPVVLVHWRGHSVSMQERAVYADVVDDVRRELGERVEAALAAGVAEQQLRLDPGIGFAKTGAHNWELLRHLDVFLATGLPLLVATSRKRFLGDLLAVDGVPRPPAGRDGATNATTVLAAAAGAWCVRVHDVRPAADAVRVVERLKAAAPTQG